MYFIRGSFTNRSAGLEYTRIATIVGDSAEPLRSQPFRELHRLGPAG